MKLSVIIPVYRGKEILRELMRRINETLAGNFEYEVLFICDGCDPTSLRVINELKKNYSSQITVYRLAQNYGQHRALQFGFGKATGDLIVTMDEDLQHDPADILRLIEKQSEGNFDIVYGRFINLQHTGFRNIISAVLRKVLKYFIPSLYDNYSPYRLIKNDIANRSSTMVCPYTFIDDFLSRVTKNITFVDITHFKRLDGRSSYTLRKLIKHGIYILLAYSGIISWLLIAAGVILFIGTLLFIITGVSPGTINTVLINNITLIEIFGSGLLLIIISLLGTLINHRSININTRPVRLINEDTI